MMFHTAETETPQDWAALSAHLARHGLKFAPDASRPRQFATGMGNLNYLIELDGKAMVLRRPPLGKIPPGANDMAREHRILSTLWQAFPLAPRSVHYTEDPAIIGAHFLIIEYRPGMAIGGEMPARFQGDEQVGARLGALLVDTLADLHGVDAEALGFGDFGKPAGFLARAVKGWSKRMGLVYDEIGRAHV